MPKQTTDQVEPTVMVVAEQLGRIIGTVHARMDALKRGNGSPEKPAAPKAQLKATTKMTTKASTKAPTKAPAAARRVAADRTRANVDAPGKKHRKPVPSDPGVQHSDERIAKLKAANESKHGRHRRG